MNISGSLSLLFDNSSRANSSLQENCGVHEQHMSIAVLLCLVFAVGFFLNCFSLWVFCCMVPRWNSGTHLQFHLVLSDVIITLTTPFMVAYFALGSHWPFGSFMCRLKIALLFIHLYGSVMFLTLISVHRYMTVVRFKQNPWMKRKKFVQALCAGVWLLILAKGTVCFVVFNTSQLDNHTLCLSIRQGQYTRTFFIFNFILLIFGFILPFSVALGCYSRLAKSVSRINSKTEKGRSIKSKSNKMVAVCLVIFLVCFLPLNIIRTVGVIVKMFFPQNCNVLLQVETAYYVSWIIAGANSCFDPLIYCFGSQNFSRAVFRSLRTIGIKVQTVQPTVDQDDQSKDDQLDPSTAYVNKDNISSSCL